MRERELEVALDAAKLASRHLTHEYERFKAIPDAPADISTDADRQSQEIILQAIRQAFPSDALCAEEATATLQGAVHTGERTDRQNLSLVIPGSRCDGAEDLIS